MSADGELERYRCAAYDPLADSWFFPNWGTTGKVVTGEEMANDSYPIFKHVMKIEVMRDATPLLSARRTSSLDFAPGIRLQYYLELSTNEYLSLYQDLEQAQVESILQELMGCE